MLLIPLVILSGLTLFMAGFAVGIVGIAVRLLTGRTELVASGAMIIRAIDQLPFGIGTDRSHVYLIGDEQGAVKIGISHDPVERLASLQTGHPESLVLLSKVSYRTSADARAAETNLHTVFAAQRMNGEWFDLSDRQLRQAHRIARRLR
ncbi:MAG: GIY-YIG nuclease family protein [Acidimicrobiales bacterium]|nr:GIY-YIG nuclease family protein [Acidimicrobiales bacterium]